MEPRQGISTAPSHLDPFGSYRGLTGQKMWTSLLVMFWYLWDFFVWWLKMFPKFRTFSKDHRTWSGMFLKWGFRWFSGVFTVTTRMWLMFEPGISKSQAILILHTYISWPFMVFVGASVLNLCLFDQKTWGNDSDVLGTVVLWCCQDCRYRIEALEDQGLKPWLMTWLYSNTACLKMSQTTTLNSALSWDRSWISLTTKPWICRSGSTVLWMDEHLGSLAAVSDEATCRLDMAWLKEWGPHDRAPNKGFFKGIRNLPEMIQILSILPIRWTKTPPGHQAF